MSEPQTVRIRPLQERDLQPLLAIFTEVAHELLWIGTEPGFDAALYRARWRNLIGATRGAAFAATCEDQIVGQISIYPHDEYGYIIGMLVDAKHRGRGIGKQLLNVALDWARSLGIPSVSLLVFPHNERAIALYEAAGFAQREYYKKDVPRRNGEVWDSILMTKDLRDA